MSAPATQDTPPGQQAPDAYAPDAYAPAAHAAEVQDHRHALNSLINIGADFARFLHGQAAAQAQSAQAAPEAPAPQPAVPAPQPGAAAPQAADAHPAPAQVASAPVADTLIRLTAAFDQLSRNVRRTVMLVQGLDKPARPAKDPAPSQAPDPARHRTEARKRILREVEDVLQRIGGGYGEWPESDEVLQAELHERLDTPSLDEDIGNRPVADIIKDICRDLGLAAIPGTRPWKRRTPADIAELCARAAAPSGATLQPSQQPGPGLQAPGLQAPGPQGPGHGTAQPGSDPEPGDQEPCGPAKPAIPRPQPGPTLPEDPAEAVAFVLHHTSRADARWRLPSEG